MKKICWVKILTATLAIAFIFTGSFPINSLAVSDTKENEKTLEDKIAGMVTIKNNDRAIDKEETVYIISAADGSTKQMIGAEWLKNPDKAATIDDYTTLKNFENTKGNETYTLSGNALVWNANGSDIHYRGATDKELPVTVKITYYLNGVETSPADMAGKSGHVTIRFDYTNHTKTTAMVNGKQTEIYVPFLLTSGLILDGDTFTNVTVSTGTVYNDGSRNIVIGCALPGLAESLGLIDGGTKIPGSVEVQADTTDFSFNMALTVAMNGLLNDFTIGNDSGLAELKSDLTNLSDAAKRMSDGASDLSDGVGKLSGGLGKISANSASLKDGANAVFKSLTDAATAQLNTALQAAGYPTVSLTPSNYSTVLTGLLDTIGSGAYSKARAAAGEQVRAAVTEQVKAKVTEQVMDAVETQVEEKVAAQAALSKAFLQTEDGQTLVKKSVEQQMASDAVKQIVSATVEQQMATEKVKQTIETYVAQQIKSDDLQAKIKNAVTTGLAGSQAYQSIVALKSQLNSYAAFYKGLSDYTAGVDAAYSGSVKIASGAGDLANGTQEFYDKGIVKLVDALNGGYEELFDRMKAVADAGKAYQSFGGISDGMTGSVRFIWKTEGI